jgi:ATP-binding cassette subfamily G (WHITE) protein 2 (PDR)
VMTILESRSGNDTDTSRQILTLYAQRPIVEKHARYALYHPFAEAVASMLCDVPYKLLNAVTFNLTVYFLTNLRREPGAFFIFWLFSIVITFTMSMIFRSVAAFSRTLSQALAPAALLILALVIYTGFTIPTRNMLGWSRWINYIDPISYSFESLMVNEFHDRTFPCTAEQLIPSGGFYNDLPIANKICSTVGATAGSLYVSGNSYLEQSFQYSYSHLWRNLGIMFGFMFFFMGTYLLGTEYVSEAKSKGEVLLFRRGHQPATVSKGSDDIEISREPVPAERTEDAAHRQEVTANIQRQTAIFHWQDVCYDIKIKGETRRILDHVDGWVKPGTCTALMVSEILV